MFMSLQPNGKHAANARTPGTQGNPWAMLNPAWMRAVFLTLFVLQGGVVLAATSMPYDETADAAVDVAAAVDQVRAEGKLLLIEFGANWCPDCRAFAEALRSPEARAVVAEKFVSVKVDVGDWDKHPEVVAAWGNPIAGGIPAIVVATAEGRVLFSTSGGQLARARNMGPDDFAAFFARLAVLAAESLR